MVTHDSRRCGFTLVDLAAVVVMAGVLAVALTAGVRQMQPRDNQVMCLTNLQRIGAAIHAYAAEDPREQAIPIHVNMVGYNDANQPTGAGLDYWLWRCANWFAWGGQGATQTFYIAYGEVGFLLNDPNELAGALPPDSWYDRPAYATRHRPLNSYIAPDPLSTFRCPSDTGYREDHITYDFPVANSDRSCWDTLGNSYRANLSSFAQSSFGWGAAGTFATGPWGHRISALPNPSRLVLVCEPIWYVLTREVLFGTPIYNGWHGVRGADNVLFCDGSARLASAIARTSGPARRPLEAETLALDTPSFLGSDDRMVAGPDWQIDCYPVPGALVWGDWSQYLSWYSDRWPWKNAQLNP